MATKQTAREEIVATAEEFGWSVFDIHSEGDDIRVIGLGFTKRFGSRLEVTFQSDGCVNKATLPAKGFEFTGAGKRQQVVNFLAQGNGRKAKAEKPAKKGSTIATTGHDGEVVVIAETRHIEL